MLTIKNLNASYNRLQVLFNVSLKVKSGEAIGIIGHNGAGKSTLIKAIMGLVKTEPVNGGTIKFNNLDIKNLESYQIARLGIGYVPEERRLFKGLTVQENLAVAKSISTTGFWSEDKIYELFPNLQKNINNYAQNLSGGEQQMLAIARTLMLQPKFLLLDEPMEGLAPIIVEQVAQTLQEIKKKHISILLTEQNLNFAKQLCDSFFYIENGIVKSAK